MKMEKKLKNNGDKVMKKKLMILGASILQLPAIEKAKEMGLDVVVVDMNPEAIGFQVEGIKKEVISTIDIPMVIKAAEKHQIDGVMTLASDMPMRTVAAVAEKMNLIGIDQETALKATNKAEMRKALREYKVPIPLFFHVNTKEEFYSAVQKIKDASCRCIVKPVDNSGSRGIDLLKDFERATLDRAYKYSKQSSRCGNLMVEEYMEGPEVSVETLSINGECHVIQITDKITTGSPYFVEMGHSQPSQLPEKIIEQIIQVAKAANKAIGIKDGPSHTEIKVTKDGPKIVELGARLGGDNITTHLTPLSTGVDMVEACINIALGIATNINKKCNKASAIKYFSTPVGIIKSINGIEDAKDVYGVNEIRFIRNVGEPTHTIKSSVDRIGYVISQAGSAEEALNICEEAMKKIKIEVV